MGLLLICALMMTGFDSVYAKDTDLYTKVYLIPPMYSPSGNSAVGSASDPFADSVTPGKKRTAKEILTEYGVTFAAGASAVINQETSQLIVKNTKDQLVLIDAYIESILGKAEKQLRVKVEWFELSHKDFSELMEREDHEHAGKKVPSNGGTLRDKVMAMVKGDKVTVIDTAMIIARSGQRAKVESVLEVIYPTKYVRSASEVVVDAKGEKTGVGNGDGQVLLLPVGYAYETRNVGTTLEVDPVLGADERTVDLSLSPEIVYFAGEEDYGVYAEGESEVVARTPVFYTVKATTQVTLISGNYLLLAAISPINEEKGRVDRRKKS